MYERTNQQTTNFNFSSESKTFRYSNMLELLNFPKMSLKSNFRKQVPVKQLETVEKTGHVPKHVNECQF